MLEAAAITVIVVAAAAQVTRTYLPRQWKLLLGAFGLRANIPAADATKGSGCASGCNSCDGCGTGKLERPGGRS